jgi:hypothetical protein
MASRIFILGSNYLSMIQRILSDVRDRWMMGEVVSDIKELAVGFPLCTFKHYAECGGTYFSLFVVNH